MLSILVLVSFILPSQSQFGSNYLQFFERSGASTSHFQTPEQQTIGLSNIPDVIARALQVGVFVKSYIPPQFLTFQPAPKGFLFVFVPQYAGQPMSSAAVSFQVDGYAKIADTLAGSRVSADVSSSLPDLTSAHFGASMVCASHCSHLAENICGDAVVKVARVSESQKIDPNFVSKFNIPQDMSKEFVLEMQFLSTVRKQREMAVFFGVSSFKKIPSSQQVEATRILGDVIAAVLNEMPENSIAAMLTMNRNAGPQPVASGVSMGTNRRLMAAAAAAPSSGPMVYYSGEFLAQIWVSVGGLFVIIAIAYYLAFMDYTQDSVLYTTMNPNLADRRR